MDYKDFIKKGAHVIRHHKKWKKVMWSNSGYGWVDETEHCEIISQPRDSETGRFTNDFYWDDSITVNLKDSNGKTFAETINNLEPDFAPCELSDEDLKTLWNEMNKGSIYYADYRNSVGVFEKTAYDFFEGYAEENWYDLKDEFPEISDEELEEKHWDSMCAEGFAAYCQSCEYLY